MTVTSKKFFFKEAETWEQNQDLSSVPLYVGRNSVCCLNSSIIVRMCSALGSGKVNNSFHNLHVNLFAWLSGILDD